MSSGSSSSSCLCRPSSFLACRCVSQRYLTRFCRIFAFSWFPCRKLASFTTSLGACSWERGEGQSLKLLRRLITTFAAVRYARSVLSLGYAMLIICLQLLLHGYRTRKGDCQGPRSPRLVCALRQDLLKSDFDIQPRRPRRPLLRLGCDHPTRVSFAASLVGI